MLSQKFWARSAPDVNMLLSDITFMIFAVFLLWFLCNEMSTLTHDLNYRSACDHIKRIQEIF